MKLKKQVKWFLVIVIVMTVIFQVGRQFFKEEEWLIRNYVHDQVKSVFPKANEKVMAGYGLIPYTSETRSVPNSSDSPKKPVVVLIHGLDEPVQVWFNLAPVLSDNGYQVLYMRYPNDQNIAASARFFFNCLSNWPFGSQDTLAVVGHSMGGLVTRQMLTDPDINYKQAQASGQVPPMKNLIMAGTPNHGSELARFRFFMEIRDQANLIMEGEGHWLQFLLDGTGAAGVDLIPGSTFLTRLNSRLHPDGVDLHVIAGILSPWSDYKIKSFMGKLGTYMPNDKKLDGFESALKKMNNTIGDGLVTIESARLENVPLTQVKGSHMTMIRNLTQESERVPPAIPVILDILKD